MSLRRTIPALATAIAVAGLLALPAATGATAAAHQELPFGCGERWTGTTRPTHSPSTLAIDFNRDRDLGRLVVASSGGVVSRVEDAGDRSYGKWIRIEHADGYSTLYAHLSAQWVVTGQRIDQGAPIGRVGDTGGVTAAHLHYEQRLGNTVQRAVFHEAPFVYGSTVASEDCPDVPLAGDWNGDGTDEVGVFRRGAGGATFLLAGPDQALPVQVRFGRATDLPVIGDWDGDGVTGVGVRRQATRSFLLRADDGTVTRIRYGFVKDVPVTGDWDGNGTTDVGIWRPGALRFHLRLADGTSQVIALGSRGSQPVTGDWDGDGSTDVGVYDAATATFSLRTVTAAGQVAVTAVPLGSSTDLPVTGDWNADRIVDVGVWTPATATFTLRVTPTPALTRSSGAVQAEIRTLAFGRPR